MTSILKRHSFWKAVLTGAQIPISSIQVIVLSEEGSRDINIILAVVQGLLATGNLLIKDDNRNDIIDIIEDPVTVTVTAPANVQVNVEETKTEPPNPMKILTIFFSMIAFACGAQDTKLFFGYEKPYDFTLFNVLKSDTIGFEQFIVPEGIKPGEKWIITATKVGTVEPPKPPVVTTIDNAHPDVKYSAGWIPVSNAAWTANYYPPALKTAAYSTTKGSTITFIFVGTGFELWFEKRSNHADFAVSIDQGTETIVDTYSPTTASPVTPEKVFEKLGLENKSHTVVIRVNGVKNPAAASAPIPAADKVDISVVIDKIVFFKPSL